MSTAISATLPLEGGSETELSHSDRDNFQACAWNLIPAWAFQVMRGALQTEEQQQVSVHLFTGRSDGKGLDLPELGDSLQLHASVLFPTT